MQKGLHESSRDTGPATASQETRRGNTLAQGNKANYAQRQPKEHARN